MIPKKFTLVRWQCTDRNFVSLALLITLGLPYLIAVHTFIRLISYVC